MVYGPPNGFNLSSLLSIRLPHASPAIIISIAIGMAKTLGELIEDGLEDSEFSKSKFLAYSIFNGLSTEHNIRKELKNHGVKRRKDLVYFIYSDAKNVFAILVRARLVSRAKNLDTCKFTDKYLPVEFEAGRVKSMSGVALDDPALEWFQTWTTTVPSGSSDEAADEQSTRPATQTIDNDEIITFCNNQGFVLAPIFTADNTIEELYKYCPLTFLTYENKLGEGGGYSSLNQGQIHGDHQKILGEVSSLQIACFD